MFQVQTKRRIENPPQVENPPYTAKTNDWDSLLARRVWALKLPAGTLERALQLCRRFLLCLVLAIGRAGLLDLADVRFDVARVGS